MNNSFFANAKIINNFISRIETEKLAKKDEAAKEAKGTGGTGGTGGEGGTGGTGGTNTETITKETKIIERAAKNDATLSSIDTGIKNLGSGLASGFSNLHSVMEDLLKVSKKKAANDLDEDAKEDKPLADASTTRIKNYEEYQKGGGI